MCARIWATSSSSPGRLLPLPLPTLPPPLARTPASEAVSIHGPLPPLQHRWKGDLRRSEDAQLGLLCCTLILAQCRQHSFVFSHHSFPLHAPILIRRSFPLRAHPILPSFVLATASALATAVPRFSYRLIPSVHIPSTILTLPKPGALFALLPLQETPACAVVARALSVPIALTTDRILFRAVFMADAVRATLPDRPSITSSTIRAQHIYKTSTAQSHPPYRRLLVLALAAIHIARGAVELVRARSISHERIRLMVVREQMARNAPIWSLHRPRRDGTLQTVALCGGGMGQGHGNLQLQEAYPTDTAPARLSSSR
ncbi:hypothetical protein C8R44DRAFT_975930 [Mycena epipterygia]|nr:hypothetical protein C8R44DRAFT_975930 [Mycena epipterygia]